MKIILLILMMLLGVSCKNLNFSNKPNWCCKPKPVTPPVTGPIYYPNLSILQETEKITFDDPAEALKYGAFVGEAHDGRYLEFTNGFMPKEEFGVLIDATEVANREASRTVHTDYDFEADGLTLDIPAVDVKIVFEDDEYLSLIGQTLIGGFEYTTLITKDRMSLTNKFINLPRSNYARGAKLLSLDGFHNLLLASDANDPMTSRATNRIYRMADDYLSGAVVTGQRHWHNLPLEKIETLGNRFVAYRDRVATVIKVKPDGSTEYEIQLAIHEANAGGVHFFKNSEDSIIMAFIDYHPASDPFTIKKFTIDE